MRLRAVVWPVAVLNGVLAMSFAWPFLAYDAELALPVVLGFLLLLPLWRMHVRLSPEGLHRSPSEKPTFIGWERVQAVALAGDTRGVCPTLWLDDGREIVLDELGKTVGVGGRRVRRNAERLRAYWELHRGPSWRPAPWAADVVPGWVAGAARVPDAVTPAAITSRLRPALATWLAYAALVCLPAATAPLRRSSWGDWLDSYEPSPAVLAMFFLGTYAANSGARLSAHGLAHGAQERVPWPRVQAVTLEGRRGFACPTVRTEDGGTVELHSLGAFFGLGRARATRMLQHIERAWLDHRGPAWQPSPPVPAPPPPPAEELFPSRPDVNYWAPPPV